MYTVESPPEVQVITSQRGNHRTVELAAGTDASLLSYYSSVYSGAIQAAIDRGDKEYAAKLQAEQNLTRISVDNFRSNVSLVQLHVSASRFFRTSWTKLGWFSGWMTARMTVKFRCTSTATPVLEDALKKAKALMFVDPADKVNDK